MYKLLLILTFAAPILTVITGFQGATITITTELTGVTEHPCWWILFLDGLLLFGAFSRNVWPLIIAGSTSLPMALELYIFTMVANPPTWATISFYSGHIFIYFVCAVLGVACFRKQVE